MKYLFYFIIGLFLFNKTQAQNQRFIAAGTIEYERKINLYSLYSNQPQFVAELKKNNLQFKRQTFFLSFNNTTTSYKPGTENPENFKLQKIPAEKNNIYTDFDNNLRVLQKNIFDKTFIILDTIKKIQWKLTDERRVIIGLECRRANAIILDSIYVVAFFTEEILVKGGPESFSGLPGMILGIALPGQHVTWFATKFSIKEFSIEKPLEGEQISGEDVKDIFMKEFKPYNEIGFLYYKFSMF